MNRNVPLSGIVAYPITPFADDDTLDLQTYRQLLDRLLNGGVHAIAALGSAGVLPYLNDGEREKITEATLSHVGSRLPVMIGVSSLTTRQTIHHAQVAEKAGAAAVMIIPMSYWKLTDEEIFQHYAKVADAISIPIMAYNNPATAGTDMTPEFLSRLLKIPNMTMVKESSGDVNRMHRLMEVTGNDVAFFNGSNPLAYSAFAAGAAGWCTAASNLIPRLNVSLYEAFMEGRSLQTAREIFHRQLPLLRFLVAEGLPRSVAAGLQIDDVEIGSLRHPLLPLPEDKKAELSRLLSAVRIWEKDS